MRLAIVFHLTGAILRFLGAAFVAPLLIALYSRESADAITFLATGVVAVVLGEVMRRQIRHREWTLKRVEALAVVVVTYLLVAMIGAVPYTMNGMTIADAMFESMSGITATGATTLTDFDSFGRGLMFWRSMSQWLGGLGIITLFIAVLPRLAIGGRQLFFTETTTTPGSGGLKPHVRETAAMLWRLYVGLTLAEFVALMLAGLSAYDAICHAMTTIAAGGFSPNPESIIGYNSAAVEWIICGFMFLAGTNFALQYQVLLRGHLKAFIADDEFRVYARIVAIATIALTIFLLQTDMATAAAVRSGLFQSLSILTTTGYASADFALWTEQSRMVLLVLMFIGGCAGSAAGGPKIWRQILIARYTLLELKRTLHPRALLPGKLGGKVVPEDVMRAVLVFFLFYLLLFAVCVGVVVALGADILTGVTATTGTLGNIGPGFGQVGPMSNYAGLHTVSKVVLTVAMLVGRLEVLTVLALLRPEAWRSLTLRGD